MRRLLTVARVCACTLNLWMRVHTQDLYSLRGSMYRGVSKRHCSSWQLHSRHSVIIDQTAKKCSLMNDGNNNAGTQHFPESGLCENVLTNYLFSFYVKGWAWKWNQMTKCFGMWKYAINKPSKSQGQMFCPNLLYSLRLTHPPWDHALWVQWHESFPDWLVTSWSNHPEPVMLAWVMWLMMYIVILNYVTKNDTISWDF